jgi:excisionase family DNA binding protein
MFSVKTAGEDTSFGERYWIERIRREEIPIVRIGRSVRILRKDLIDFLESKINE